MGDFNRGAEVERKKKRKKRQESWSHMWLRSSTRLRVAVALQYVAVRCSESLSHIWLRSSTSRRIAVALQCCSVLHCSIFKSSEDCCHVAVCCNEMHSVAARSCAFQCVPVRSRVLGHSSSCAGFVLHTHTHIHTHTHTCPPEGYERIYSRGSQSKGDCRVLHLYIYIYIYVHTHIFMPPFMSHSPNTLPQDHYIWPKTNACGHAHDSYNDS